MTIVAGTFSHGQGHEKVFAQLVSDWLGVPFEPIRLIQGGTVAVSFGHDTLPALGDDLVAGKGRAGAARHRRAGGDRRP